MLRTITLAGLVLAVTATIVGLDRKDEPNLEPEIAFEVELGADQPAPQPEATVEQTELDRLIDLFTERASDRATSIEYRQLGLLLLERAEQESRLADYRGAVDAFTSALATDPDDATALIGQGRAALGVHDFTAALAAADQIARLAPEDPEGLTLIGDVSFAVGDDERAALAFDRLESIVGPDPAILVRQAELAGGAPGDEAERLGRQALAAAERAGLEPGSLAFYQTFVGRQAFDRGDLATAGRLLEAALVNAPDDHGTLGELARVRAAEGEIGQAIELLERANAIVPEPDHLTLQGDLRTLLDDPAQDAAAAADRAAGVALANLDDDHRRAWARSLATYHLDHLDAATGQNTEPGGGSVDPLAVALEIAETERATRRDAGAYDLMAWAAYRAGDLATARAEIDVALSLDQTSATIRYHGAKIAAAEGDLARARVEIDTALSLNPGFDPLLAADARRLRAELDGG